ncbi:dTMP kinase [Schaalia naturae]|jgi:dTMP kinase|uniref:Thymidylate kinase n=1 Tax=Schaalia naturae TaxID=635203 RepID=A0ABW2SQ38_9ACTO
MTDEGTASAGLFITFEGGDGSGKTTQIRRVGQWFTDRGRRVLLTREPGGTELGGEIRRLVQHGPEDVDARTEALLYAADRAYHVSTVVRPALEDGAVVLSDRYIDSSVAYQGAARDLGTGEILKLSEWATEGLRPDLTFLLDLPPEVGARRGSGDPDRLEREPGEFHERVRHEYLQLAEEDPDRIVVIDAVGTPGQVFSEIRGVLEERFYGHRVDLDEETGPIAPGEPERAGGGPEPAQPAGLSVGGSASDDAVPDGPASDAPVSPASAARRSTDRDGVSPVGTEASEEPSPLGSQATLWGDPGEGMLL